MLSLRDQFLLDPNVIFLNHGSAGATPRPVFESYQRWQLELERQPVDFLGRRANELLRASRSVLADYLGTQADNLAYITNTTVGINIIANSLDLKPGEEVLSTDQEYGAMDTIWQYHSKKRGFTYINYSIPLPVTSSQELVDQFWSNVTPATRVIYLSHVSSPTAMIFPVDLIVKRARQAGILSVIDGAHAPGQIPLSLDQLGADFYVGNLHKWLCTPKGSGFIYARPEVQNLIEPLVISWGYHGGVPDASKFVDILEINGTRDIAAFLAVPDAIKFCNDHNWPAVQANCHALAKKTRQEITNLSGVPALYPDSPEWYAQMGTASLSPSIDARSLSNYLYQEHHIEIPVIGWNDYRLVRFSIQAYNDERDVEILIDALKRF